VVYVGLDGIKQEGAETFMITKTLKIDGKNVTFGASAGTVRAYRNRFGRDIIKDVAELYKSLEEANINAGAAEDLSDSEKIAAASALPVFALETFENLAYIMAKAVDSTIPDDVGEWLDEFNSFSIYEVAPALIALWAANTKTTATPKKK